MARMLLITIAGVYQQSIPLLWRGPRSPRYGGGEACVLMRIPLFLVHLNGLEEGLPLADHFLVLHRDHLVEVNVRIPLVVHARLLITKSLGAATERLHVISRAELVVENLELVLDLRIIAARPRILLLLSRDMVHDVSLDG